MKKQELEMLKHERESAKEFLKALQEVLVYYEKELSTLTRSINGGSMLPDNVGVFYKKIESTLKMLDDLVKTQTTVNNHIRNLNNLID